MESYINAEGPAACCSIIKEENLRTICVHWRRLYALAAMPFFSLKYVSFPLFLHFSLYFLNCHSAPCVLVCLICHQSWASL